MLPYVFGALYCQQDYRGKNTATGFIKLGEVNFGLELNQRAAVNIVRFTGELESVQLVGIITL